VSRLLVLIKFSHISMSFVPPLNMSQLADSCLSAIHRSNVFTRASRGNLSESSISDGDLSTAESSVRATCAVYAESTLLLKHGVVQTKLFGPKSPRPPLIYVSGNVFCSNKSCVMLSRKAKSPNEKV
jgi:hypothetical protein